MTIQKGLGAITDAIEHSSGMSYFKIGQNEEKIIRFLLPPEQLISVYEHVEQFPVGWRTFTCLGKDSGCPLCAAGLRASFQTYIPIIDKSDNNRVKILKAGVKMGAQILGLIKEYGDITKRDFKIQKIGAKFNTQYLFYAKDPTAEDWSKAELPDVMSAVQPKDAATIQAAMNGEGAENTAPVNFQQPAPAQPAFQQPIQQPVQAAQVQQPAFQQPAQTQVQQPAQTVQAPTANKYPF